MSIKSNLKHNFKNLRPHWRHKGLYSKRGIRLPGKKSLEDTIESLTRRGIIAKAGLRAIKDQHEKGLAVTLKIGDSIYCLYPNGRKEEISRSSMSPARIEQDFLQIPD
jgi:hypothetical protein